MLWSAIYLLWGANIAFGIRRPGLSSHGAAFQGRSVRKSYRPNSSLGSRLGDEVTSGAIFVNEPQAPRSRSPANGGGFLCKDPVARKGFSTFTLLTRRPYYAFEMRGLAAAVVIFVALSVVTRGHLDRFVLRDRANASGERTLTDASVCAHARPPKQVAARPRRACRGRYRRSRVRCPTGASSGQRSAAIQT